jgi:RNA polymerase sigma-70 factor (ECF subfamily)
VNRTGLSRVGAADWKSAAGAAVVFAGSNDRLDLAREQEFAAFVAAHRDRALRMAWRLLGGDGAAAEDVVQEAFARAHRNLARFREEAKLSTWFHRILVNEARRHRRWSWVRRRVAGEMPFEIRDERSARGGDPALRARIAAAIARLPRGQREAFVLVHLEDMTLAEAAEASGRAIGTIKSHLHRACRALRAELADLDPKLEANPA